MINVYPSRMRRERRPFPELRVWNVFRGKRRKLGKWWTRLLWDHHRRLVDRHWRLVYRFVDWHWRLVDRFVDGHGRLVYRFVDRHRGLVDRLGKWWTWLLWDHNRWLIDWHWRLVDRLVCDLWWTRFLGDNDRWLVNWKEWWKVYLWGTRLFDLRKGWQMRQRKLWHMPKEV